MITGGMETGDDLRESGLQSTATAGVVRGWEETFEDSVVLDPPEDCHPHASSNLRCMAHLMLQSLKKDPRVRGIKEKDDYWLASLLDPQYKAKVSEFILPAHRENRMRHLQQALKNSLLKAYPDSRRSQSHPKSALGADAERRSGEAGSLSDAFKTFFSSPRPGLSTSNTYRQRLHHMVEDYLAARVDVGSFPAGDALAYWVMRLDHWPQLAQYALELLSCPASSVLSERTFSAAGGVVTDKRVRLSTDAVDKLTFIKMNECWISSSYHSPDADVAD